MTSLDDRTATTVANELAQNWGTLSEPTTLIRNRENIVFRARFTDGRDTALRLHRPGYQTKARIEAELIWTAQLAEMGFPCPVPHQTQTGEWVTENEDTPLASLVSWIDAQPIGENGIAFEGGHIAQLDTYTRLGQLLRRLHDLTARCDTATLDRPRWDLDGFLGDTPHWNSFWTNPSLSQKQRDYILDIRQNAAQHFLRLNPPLQLIHADLLQENILQKNGQLHLIDFDDCGFGPFLYDLGTALIQHAEYDQLNDIKQAISEGYGISIQQELELDFFIMLRSMASAGWTISRYDPAHAAHRFYAERMLRCAAKWSGEPAPI